MDHDRWCITYVITILEAEVTHADFSHRPAFIKDMVAVQSCLLALLDAALVHDFI
jgi:hypothetical protein